MHNQPTPKALQTPAARMALLATALAIIPAFFPGAGFVISANIYPSLHTIIEVIAIAIGCLVFTLAWESRSHRSPATLLLACAFFAAALLDLGHLLAYPGMPDFITPNSAHKAISFWLAARLIVSAALLPFALRPLAGPSVSPATANRQAFGALAVALLLSWLFIFHPEMIPATFIQDKGLTPFKVVFEWSLIILNGSAALLLARRFKAHGHPSDLWLAAAAWIMALAEVFFTLYSTVSDCYNLLGHVFKTTAYLLAYQALIKYIVSQPYTKLDAEIIRYRTILETAHDGIYVVNLQGRIVDSNAAFARMLGYTPDEIRQMHVVDIEASKSAEEIAAVIEHLCNEKPNTLFETSLRGKDGRVIDVEIAISLGHLPDGDFLVVAARSLADRKTRESLSLAGEVFQRAHVGLLITDPNGVIVELNPAVCTITGYQREELLGGKTSILKSGRHNTDFYTAMWTTLLSEGFWSSEICNRRKNGELYYELLSITAIRNRDKQVINYLAVFTDITTRKLAEENMRRIAHFDALTGLPNRLLLADRLDQAFAQNRRSGKLLAICFMDLDGFKQINDNLGHEIGDLLLKEVAVRLQSLLRASDTIARLGGDEFVMLITGLNSEEECCQTLDRILGSIATPYALVGNTPSEISASIGVTLHPADASNPDTLLRHADQAMYAAKQAGKNCYQLFDTRMEQRLQARLDTLRRVARGLSAGQFQLHYQPKVDYFEQTVIGIEALIRWQHPILGNLMPSEFLPLLEDDDLALVLGEWVVREALRQGRAWQAEGINLCISVNAFPRQLQRLDFPDVVKKAIEEVWPDLPAGRLMIEITETAALRELESVQKVIQRCRTYGIAFSLDDFGTGYASLSYLRQLTVDELKIDQSFVRDMLVDAEDLSIINGLIGLGRAFNLKVVAEGVETGELADRLAELGCAIMQGYGIARPMPASQLGPWLKKFSENSLRNCS